VARPAAPDVRLENHKLRAARVLAVTVDESALPGLVEQIEDELDLIGHASIVGRTLTWSPAAQGSEGRQLVVTVRPRDGGTEIHVEERYEMAGLRAAAPGLGGAMGFVVGGAFAASLGLADGAVIAMAAPMVILGIWMGVKGVENTFVQSTAPQLQRLLDRLSGVLRPGGGES
jgi:hypothetical protein